MKSQLNYKHIDTVLEWCYNKGLTDIDVNDLTHPPILAVGHPRDELIKWLTAMDEHRGTNSKQTLPWIYQ